MKYTKTVLLLLIITKIVQVSDTYQENIKLVFDELNKVRAEPKSLIPFLQNGITEFNGKIRNGVMTAEGAGAWQELLSVLEIQQAMEPITWSNGMAKACQLFVEWSGPNGVVSHIGPSGKSMADRLDEQGTWSTAIGENLAYGYLNGKESLVQLMVDDGVSSRGHRKNILKTNFGVVGIAINTHSNYSYITCMDFAGGFSSTQDTNPTYTWTPTTPTNTNDSSNNTPDNSTPNNSSTSCSNANQIYYCKTPSLCLCIDRLEGCLTYSIKSGYCNSCAIFYKKNKYGNDGGYCQLRWEYVILVVIIIIICIPIIIWGIVGYTKTDICRCKNKGNVKKNDHQNKFEKDSEIEVQSKRLEQEISDSKESGNIKDNPEENNLNEINIIENKIEFKTPEADNDEEISKNMEYKNLNKEQQMNLKTDNNIQIKELKELGDKKYAEFLSKSALNNSFEQQDARNSDENYNSNKNISSRKSIRNETFNINNIKEEGYKCLSPRVNKYITQIEEQRNKSNNAEGDKNNDLGEKKQDKNEKNLDENDIGKENYDLDTDRKGILSRLKNFIWKSDNNEISEESKLQMLGGQDLPNDLKEITPDSKSEHNEQQFDEKHLDTLKDKAHEINDENKQSSDKDSVNSINSQRSIINSFYTGLKGYIGKK